MDEGLRTLAAEILHSPSAPGHDRSCRLERSPTATLTMSSPHDAPVTAMHNSEPPPKEPRLDAGNKHHDHCVCPDSDRHLTSQETAC